MVDLYKRRHSIDDCDSEGCEENSGDFKSSSGEEKNYYLQENINDNKQSENISVKPNNKEKELTDEEKEAKMELLVAKIKNILIQGKINANKQSENVLDTQEKGLTDKEIECIEKYLESEDEDEYYSEEEDENFDEKLFSPLHVLLYGAAHHQVVDCRSIVNSQLQHHVSCSTFVLTFDSLSHLKNVNKELSKLNLFWFTFFPEFHSFSGQLATSNGRF